MDVSQSFGCVHSVRGARLLELLADLVAGELFGVLGHHLELSWLFCCSKSRPNVGSVREVGATEWPGNIPAGGGILNVDALSSTTG